MIMLSVMVSGLILGVIYALLTVSHRSDDNDK